MKHFVFTFLLFIALVVITACTTPVRYSPKRVYVTRPSSVGFTGNVYHINAITITNLPDIVDTGYPKRVNITMALDGSNFNRVIGYGVPSESNRFRVSYDYSLPWWDRTLLTTNMFIRISDLEGTKIAQSARANSIVGVFIDSPSQGDTLVNGAFYDIEFYQVGCGSEVTLGYVTPTLEHTVVMTWSNCVHGANTLTWQCSLPVTNQLALAIQSVSDTKIWAKTGVLTVQ